jgi:predicted  nucleic acid-binding Zn-ribbon protein
MNDSLGATQEDVKKLHNNMHGMEGRLSEKLGQQGQDLQKEMREVMGEYTQEILNALSPEILTIKEGVKTLQHDVSGLKQDVSGLREDVDSLTMTTERIERKLDLTIERVDQHSVQIAQLKTRAA